MNKLEESVIKAATAVREKLDDEGWLRFAKLSQLQRFELNKLVAGQLTVNCITYVRVAAALEILGVKTRLSEVDPASREVLINLGLTAHGNFKDFLEKVWDHRHITSYLCEGVAMPEQTQQRIALVERQLGTLAATTGKKKVDLLEVDYLKLKLGTLSVRTAHTFTTETNIPQGNDEQFKTHVLALLALSEGYTDASVSEVEREQLRKVVGQDNIFALKNILSRLCSSRAFGNRN